jgi:hypothetical protein
MSITLNVPFSAGFDNLFYFTRKPRSLLRLAREDSLSKKKPPVEGGF